MSQLDHHAALIYTMVIVSAADGDMDDAELGVIGDIVRQLPAFDGFDRAKLPGVAESCASILADEDGFDTVLTVIAETLPAKLRETAYAVACDVAAANLDVEQEELTVLRRLRWQLGLERLTAAAIERGTRARHQKL